MELNQGEGDEIKQNWNEKWTKHEQQKLAQGNKLKQNISGQGKTWTKAEKLNMRHRRTETKFSRIKNNKGRGRNWSKAERNQSSRESNQNRRGEELETPPRFCHGEFEDQQRRIELQTGIRAGVGEKFEWNRSRVQPNQPKNFSPKVTKCFLQNM